MRALRVCIITESNDQHSSNWSGSTHRWLKRDFPDVEVYHDHARGHMIPLDHDLYLIHGTVKMHDYIHIQPIQVMRFGSFDDSIRAPLDELEIKVNGRYGNDHGTLTSNMQRLIRERIAIVKGLEDTQFHLSSDWNIEGVWKPRYPVGDHDPDMVPEKTVAKPPTNILYTETQAPRICTAPTILGCFYGIYPNIAKKFEDPKCTHMDFFVYVATNYNRDDFMNYPEIIANKIVWDAHLSLECNIFSEARMRLLPAMVRFHNHNKTYTNREYHNWIRPYNDPNEAETYHSPIVRYHWKES